MPILNFSGNTFVAYIDISGFKILMKNRDKAISTLQHFYRCGFNIIDGQLSQENKIEGFFISDCAVLFVRDNNCANLIALKKLLDVIESLNKKMLEIDIMLTNSICYGYFSYEGKLEISGTEKNQIFGDAYVEAFLDNEAGNPRIKPGECRILIKNIPQELNYTLSLNNEFSRIRKNGKHYYYFWMVNSNEEIEDFIKRYNDSYNLQFRGMLEALKGRS